MALNKFFRLPFANSGDKAAVPDAVVPAGDVSYDQGYGPYYQLPKINPLAKDIERDKMNQVLNDVTKAIQEYQVNGVPDWITNAQNGGTAYPYPQGARVRYTDGRIYVSITSSNTLLPTNTTGWIAETGRLIGVQTFVASGTYTPTPGTARIIGEAIGGGGGGGGVPSAPGSASAAGGGSSGSYGRFYLVAPAATTVTIGAGGVGVSAGTGAGGGNTIFGVSVSFPGGSGAIAGSTSTSAGVTGTPGGSPPPPSGANIFGAQGAVSTLPGFVLASTSALAGGGGTSPYGGGGGAIGVNGTYAISGSPAVGYGAGGGGAVGANHGVTLKGGDGRSGILIIYEYA